MRVSTGTHLVAPSCALTRLYSSSDMVISPIDPFCLIDDSLRTDLDVPGCCRPMGNVAWGICSVSYPIISIVKTCWLCDSPTGTLVTESCVAVIVAIDIFCRTKEGFRMDVIGRGRRKTGKAAWNFPAVSTVVGSCWTARSRRFNTRRFTRMADRLVMVTISTQSVWRYHWQGQLARGDAQVRVWRDGCL